MGTYTEKLNLYKTNMLTDGNDLFDFKRDLDDNWDKIDTGFATLDTKCDGKQDKLTAGYNIDIDSNIISASGKYPYSFNAGNIDNNGNADLIAYSGSDVTYKVGNTYPNLTGTQADGQQFTLTSLTGDDVSGLADGSYKKYAGADGSAELLNNTLSISKTEPSTPAANDVWINNAVSPLTVKKYVAPNYTEVGDPTINNGVVSAWDNSNKVNYATVNGGSSTDYEIHYRLLTPNSSFASGGTYTALYIYGINNSHTWIYGEGSALKIHGSGFSYANIADSIPDNTDYIDVIVKNNGTAFTVTTYKPNGDVIKTVTSGTGAGNLTLNDNTSFKITDSNFITGTPLYQIDMTYMKIYVNDELVYQPNVLNNGWVNYNKIPLGKITVASGAVSAVESYPYNIDYIGAGSFAPTGAYKTLEVLSSGGNYTAPANGYFYFSSGDGVLQIGNNATQSLGMTSKYEAGSPAYGAKVFCPVQKGQSVFLRYSGTVENAYFIYSKDSRNEAI